MSKSPYEILSMLFSEDGFTQGEGAFSIKLNNNVKAVIHQNEQGFVLSFPDVKPEAVIKKVVRLKLKINGIEFKEDRGVLQIHRFPDIPFMYDWVIPQEAIGSVIEMDAIAKTRVDMAGPIISKYGTNEKDKKIANDVLNLCEEWAIIKGTVGFSDMSDKEAKAACKTYVKENLQPVGSFLFSLLVSVIVRLIIEWIINNYVTTLRKNIGNTK